MNAKHSAIFLTGLLFLMIGIAWAQTTETPRPTCPAVIPKWNANWRPSNGSYKWLRADWNANADQWEIDCGSEMSDGNSTNALSNALPTIFNRANYNMNANAVNANTVRRSRPRRPRD